MTLGYLAYRCPHCGSDRCGNDANAGWDVVTQQSVLLGEFDSQWCNDCGDVRLEEYECGFRSDAGHHSDLIPAGIPN